MKIILEVNNDENTPITINLVILIPLPKMTM